MKSSSYFMFAERNSCYIWTFANREIPPVWALNCGTLTVLDPSVSVFSIFLIARLEIRAPGAQNLAKSTLSRTQECSDPIGISDCFSLLRSLHGSIDSDLLETRKNDQSSWVRNRHECGDSHAKWYRLLNRKIGDANHENWQSTPTQTALWIFWWIRLSFERYIP